MQAAGVHGLGAHCVLSLHGAGERSSGMQRANIRGIASKYHAHRGTPHKVLVFDSRPLSVGSGEGKWNAQSQKLTGKGRENWGTGANWRQLKTVLTWNGRASRFGVPAGGSCLAGCRHLGDPTLRAEWGLLPTWEASTTTSRTGAGNAKPSVCSCHSFPVFKHQKQPWNQCQWRRLSPSLQKSHPHPTTNKPNIKPRTT